MAFLDVINELTSMVGIRTKKEKVWSFIKPVLIGLVLLLFAGAGYLMYRWYRVSQEENAQKLLGEYTAEFQKAFKNDKPQEWSDVASLFKLGYDQHAGSTTGVYFLGFQADALVKQGKRVQAVEVLNTMIPKLGNRPDITPLFKLKRSLIKLDIKDNAVVEQGLQELADLAQDASNNYRDIAQFYYGYYFWTKNDLAKAQSIWQEFVTEQQTAKPPLSPWVSLAEQKLAQIN